MEIDIQFVFPDGPVFVPEILPDGTWYDPCGALMRNVKNDFCEYTECIKRALADAEDISDLEAFDKWPDASVFDWEHFSEKIGNLHEKRVIKRHAGGLYENAWGMRGQEQFLMDMVLNPEMAHYIMGKINALIKSFGKKILYHSCGSVISQIDNIRKLPIDILNPLQPMAAGMDFETIKNTWGDTLCFHGGICVQQTLPFGTPVQVRSAVKHAISVLGRDGGYIMTSAHYIQNDTPVENILAMYDTALR